MDNPEELLIENARKGRPWGVLKAIELGAIRVEYAMELAAEGGHIDVMRAISYRASLSRANMDTILYKAAKGGSKKCVKLCFKLGATDAHELAVFKAVEHNHIPLVEYLLEAHPPTRFSMILSNIAAVGDSTAYCAQLVLENARSRGYTREDLELDDLISTYDKSPHRKEIVMLFKLY